MAGSMSDYMENKVIDHCMGKTSFTMPATVAIALCTTCPTDASTGATIVEANYTTYARKTLTPASDLNAAASGSMTNALDITFAACTSGSSTILGIATCDSATIGAGNMLYWSDVTSKLIDVSNTPPVIKAGSLTITQS